MVKSHGSQEPCSQEALQRSCSEGVRRYSGHHEDSCVRSEVRQQLHAGEDDLVTTSSESASFRYRAFGLCIDSNLPLAGLPSALKSDSIDICVHFAHEDSSSPLELLHE